MTQTQGLVCGLVSADLVKKIVGSHAIGTRGIGITPAAERAVEPANCTVQDADTSTTVLQVSIGEVSDVTHWRTQLAHEAASKGTNCVHYTSSPGIGYGCTYDSGVFVDGAGVNVVKGDRLIRVTVSHWSDVTPDDRLTLAEQIVTDVDKNVSAYDKSHP